MNARSALIDRATICVADERKAKGCIHVRNCGCRGKWRIAALIVVTALLDAGWTLTPPTRSDKIAARIVPEQLDEYL